MCVGASAVVWPLSKTEMPLISSHLISSWYFYHFFNKLYIVKSQKPFLSPHFQKTNVNNFAHPNLVDPLSMRCLDVWNWLKRSSTIQRTTDDSEDTPTTSCCQSKQRDRCFWTHWKRVASTKTHAIFCWGQGKNKGACQRPGVLQFWGHVITMWSNDLAVSCCHLSPECPRNQWLNDGQHSLSRVLLTRGSKCSVGRAGPLLPQRWLKCLRGRQQRDSDRLLW